MRVSITWTVCVAFALACAAVAQAGEMVVLESDLFGLVPGDVVDGTQVLEVPDGKRLTLMAQTGEMVELKGPYSGAPEPGASEGGNVVSTIAELLLYEGSDESSLGAIRASVGASMSDPWLIDVSQEGPHCYRAGATVVMSRRSPDLFSQIRISDGKKAAKTGWPEGEAMLGWPPPIAPADGGNYRITLDGTRQVPLSLHAVPESLASVGAQAAWMVKVGCRVQALKLLARSGG